MLKHRTISKSITLLLLYFDRVVAVGLMACSLAELVASGLTGNAVFILHVLDDKLWGMGPKKVLSPVLIEEQEQGLEDKTTENKDENSKEETKQEEAQLDKKENEGQIIEERKIENDNESEDDKEESKVFSMKHTE